MASETARTMNRYCLIDSISTEAAFFTAALGGPLPIGQVTESVGIEFRGKLVFILLYTLSIDS
jgi:hypothetical protein